MNSFIPGRSVQMPTPSVATPFTLEQQTCQTDEPLHSLTSATVQVFAPYPTLTIELLPPPSEAESKKMPAHWKPDTLPSAVQRIVFTTLCVTAVGHLNLTNVWHCCQSDVAFEAGKKELNERITTVTVVAGLLLSAVAAFITTPPPVTSIINYNMRGPYLLLFVSFGITLGGLIVGSAVIYVMTKADREWFKDTFMSSRSSICCWLIITGYPFFSTGASTSTAAFGLLFAAWNSSDRLVTIGAAFLLIAPASMIFLFLWTQLPAPQYSTPNEDSP